MDLQTHGEEAPLLGETRLQHPNVSPVADLDGSSTSAELPRYIVGMGASAGGLEALEEFFRQIPADTGMAFVVVQHLSPDFESVMDELLVRQTELPVQTVVDGMPVLADHVYLIPPKKEMIISGGRLLLTDKDPKQGLTLPIDQFFRSLAQDVGSRSIGIVLSGTGSDGSRGIREIHDAGGLVIAQDESSAKFDGMPRSALATGVVDIALPPSGIADALVRYVQHPIASELQPPGEKLAVGEDSMNRLLRMLRDAFGIDFSLYKPSTVTRRIERRLQLNQSLDFNDYVERVMHDPEELNSLYRDLLVGVTQFFRDPDAFAVLESDVIPQLIDRVPDNEELRVWVAGCATGEEAYSLAMLIHERLVEQRRPVTAKIFATDVHRASLDVASTGIYTEESLGQLTPERRARYFARMGDRYQVSGDLRQMVVFAPHNIIKDAPFTRLDLVSCRNLLIYLQPAAQKKVISLFHFALRTGGYLLLGPSEGVGDLSDEFTVVDQHWKAYRKRRDVRLNVDLRLPFAGAGLASRTRTQAGTHSSSREGDLSSAYTRLLEQYMPPAILINERREVVHVFGEAAKFLQFKPGRTSADLLDLLDGELKTAVTGAIQRASKGHQPASYQGIRMQVNGQERSIQIGVTPLLSRSAEVQFVLVTLESRESVDQVRSEIEDDRLERIDLDDAARERIRTLEGELRHTRENLQATIEELETSNEELQAANEELIASNEELQSTNEELHSVNEELFTVNAEYQRKITELTELTDDMNNLLDSTEIGTIFLDEQLCIRKLTPQITRTFNILPQDVGRQFDSFTHHIEHSTLMEDVRHVLETGEPFEQNVQDRFGRWYLLRLRPYRTGTQIEGVVLTLIDIQSHMEAELKLREMSRRMQGILDNAPLAICMKDLDGRYVVANAEYSAHYGVEPREIVGRTDYDFLPQSLADRAQAADRHVAAHGETVRSEESLSGRTYLTVRYPMRGDDGRICGIACIATDITSLKEAEDGALEAVRMRDRFLATLSHELRNPLAAVHGSATYLKRAGTGRQQTDAVCELLLRQTNILTRLCDDLLDMSRIEQGKIELRYQMVDLRQPTDDAIESVRLRVATREIELCVHMPDEPLNVYGDPARLQQIETNLLINAAKYTPMGGRIEFSLFKDGESAVIRVADNGVGMTPELMERAFDLFVQADQTIDRAEGGMGIGLTLVRSLVQLHSGTVVVESPGPGQGSTFTVRLPLSPQAPVPHDVDESPQVAAVGEIKLLIIDDNADTRAMMRLLLQFEGYAVETADSGPSGLEAILQHRPDVALVDIGLPGIDGYEVARRVRQELGRRDVVLVALTGYAQEADRRRAYEAGFDYHLSKPVDVDSLLKLLTKIAGSLSRR